MKVTYFMKIKKYIFHVKLKLLIEPISVYRISGLELGFFSGVYSSCIGFTMAFENSKALVGLSGIFIGLGEVTGIIQMTILQYYNNNTNTFLGGAVFGIFGKKTVKWGREPLIASGFTISTITYLIIFLNLPNDSPFEDTISKAIITSNAVLAMLCSFLRGLSDACFHTQIYSMLGAEYSDQSAPAFAIFRFIHVSSENFNEITVKNISKNKFLLKRNKLIQ